MIIFGLIVLCAIIYYIYFRSMRKHMYAISNVLPGVGCLPIIGHMHWFMGGPEKILKNLQTLCEQIDESGGISNVWIGPTFYIFIVNPDDIQKILDNCLEKDESYKFLRKWLGNGLFVAPVDLWKAHRKVLLPIFNNRLIDNYIDVFGEQGSVLVKRLEEQSGKGEFDVYQYVTACMLDIVFETAMGEKMDVQNKPNTPYLRARSYVISVINLRLFKAWLQPDSLFNLTPYYRKQKADIDFTHKFTDEVVIKKRAAHEKNEFKEDPNNVRQFFDTHYNFEMSVTKYGTESYKDVVIKKRAAHEKNEFKEGGRKDLLDLLLTREIKFTNQELREHIDSITIAGNDTTALVISFALQLLGRHQPEQERVYEELQEIFGSSSRLPTKEDLSRMDYLKRVLKETMRLYTVVPIIARKTQREIKLSTCTLPAGVGCAVVPYYMHKSKKLWGPDVDEFNPDRFLPENSASRHPCTYIPFSYGARNCIGRHFGMLAMKSILANILRTYKVHATPTSCDRVKIEILLFPVSGNMISLEKRVTCDN